MARLSRDNIGRSTARRARGLSLVELMIALALGLLVAEGIFLLFSMTNRAYATQSAVSHVQENGRLALSILSQELALTGHLPCGTRMQPQVYVDELPAHITGQPAAARVPAQSAADSPYPLDRTIYLSGNTCSAKDCSPPIDPSLGLPPQGSAAGQRIIGSDVLLVRYIREVGAARGELPGCSNDAFISKVVLRNDATKAPLLDAFKKNHVALMSNCSATEILPVKVLGDDLIPVTGKFGPPKCLSTASPLSVFDFDNQLQTSIYFLQLVPDETDPMRIVASLMRRRNGTTEELIRGVERLDVRYSVTDAKGIVHWLTAGEVYRGVAGDGSALQCAVSIACTWSDVAAVEVSMLLNNGDDLPIDVAKNAWSYRYSIDGDEIHQPGDRMPVTGLPAGRKVRREFRTVVALRNLSP